ncbi:flavin reductase family protein [Streptomyces sp. NPDC006184]|uniref:flavin reductase family protein n=1 Tax=unclassified Streptomyces TaxID=2593676 RepID=UPI0033BCD82C
MDRRRAFRDLLGSMPTGVCVVTTDGPSGRAGMTVSSVCSLSLEPLLLLTCLGNGSRTLRAVRGNGRFAVNLLRDGQTGAAGRFATDRPAEEKFAAAGHDLVDGSPVLRQVLGWLTCQVYSAVPAGDHTIVVGEVLGLSRSPGAPLIWHGGRYGHCRTADHNSPTPTIPSAVTPRDRP